MPVDFELAGQIKLAWLAVENGMTREERDDMFNRMYRQALAQGWGEGYGTGLTDATVGREWETKNPYRDQSAHLANGNA